MWVHKQHRGFAVADLAFHLGHCVEAPAGKAFGEQWQEIRDGGPRGELVIRRVQEPFDRLHAERFGEIALQVGRGDVQRRQIAVVLVPRGRGFGHDDLH